MIQPLLPERLPCYDLVPIAELTLAPRKDFQVLPTLVA